MKDYYLFADEGNPLKIEINNDVFTFVLKDDVQFEASQVDSSLIIKQVRVRSSFTKEQLINQLETFLNHVKKKV